VAVLDRFVDETAALGAKLGPVLVQLPPSLAFDPVVAAVFWRDLLCWPFGSSVPPELL